jgi:hypothetical protein
MILVRTNCPCLRLGCHNYPNGIISRLSSRQSHDKFHGNLSPLPHKHLWLGHHFIEYNNSFYWDVGTITRSRAQQLCHQVNSFLCSSANDLENRWLPNVLIVIRNQGVDHGGHVGHQDGAREPRKHAQQGVVPSQFGVQDSDFESNPKSRTTLH